MVDVVPLILFGQAIKGAEFTNFFPIALKKGFVKKNCLYIVREKEYSKQISIYEFRLQTRS